MNTGRKTPLTNLPKLFLNTETAVEGRMCGYVSFFSPKSTLMKTKEGALQLCTELEPQCWVGGHKQVDLRACWAARLAEMVSKLPFWRESLSQGNKEGAIKEDRTSCSGLHMHACGHKHTK